MKLMNIAKKYAPRMNKAKAAIGGGLMLIGTAAQAALPQSFTEALNGAKADGLEAGWLVVGVIAALFVIGIIKRITR